MLQKLLWLAVAGACGTVGRFTVCELADRARTGSFPLGTFTVNILGSFFFGLIYVLAQKKMHINAEIRLIALTGFIGSFTTFSTYAFDTAKLLRSAEWMTAAGNIFGHTILGVAALVAGVLIGRML
jgi:CrcB protein